MKKLAIAKLKAYEKCLLTRCIDRTIEDMGISQLSPAITETPVKSHIHVAGVGDFQHLIIGLGSTSELAGRHLTRQLEKTLGEKPSFQKEPWIVEFPLKDYLDHVKDRYGEDCGTLFRQYLRTGSSYTGYLIFDTYQSKSLRGDGEEGEKEGDE